MEAVAFLNPRKIENVLSCARHKSGKLNEKSLLRALVARPNWSMTFCGRSNVAQYTIYWCLKNCVPS